MQAGTDRAIPTSVAAALSKEIKDFIEDEAPLMMLMSSPGIKKRHWDQIVKTTGIALPYEQDFVLRDLLDAGLQNFCAEIEEVRLSYVQAREGPPLVAAVCCDVTKEAHAMSNPEVRSNSGCWPALTRRRSGSVQAPTP